MTVETEQQLKHQVVTATVVNTAGVEQPPLSKEATQALAPLTVMVPKAPAPVVVTPSANFPTAKELEAGAEITCAMMVAGVVSYLVNDPEYAMSWHAALSMSIRDEGVDAYKANRAAAAFLAMLTQGKLDMTKNEDYIALIKSYDLQLAAMGIEQAKETLRQANQGPLEIEDSPT